MLLLGWWGSQFTPHHDHLFTETPFLPAVPRTGMSPTAQLTVTNSFAVDRTF